MKYKRHSKLLEIIQNENIETQEDISSKLKSCGFDVTQATVSRDIKELRLIKTLNDKGIYKYSLPENNSQNNTKTTKYYSILKDSIIRIEYAVNMIVVKCYVGMAQGTCAAIDSLLLPGVIGTLAGDDTIFIVAVNESKAVDIVSDLNKMIK